MKRENKKISIQMKVKQVQITNKCQWRKTDKAREQRWDKNCAELEEHDRQGKKDLLYKPQSQLIKTERKKTKFVGTW